MAYEFHLATNHISVSHHEEDIDDLHIRDFQMTHKRSFGVKGHDARLLSWQQLKFLSRGTLCPGSTVKSTGVIRNFARFVLSGMGKRNLTKYARVVINAQLNSNGTVSDRKILSSSAYRVDVTRLSAPYGIDLGPTFPQQAWGYFTASA